MIENINSGRERERERKKRTKERKREGCMVKKGYS